MTKESCTRCPGFQCVDTPTGRVMTDMQTMEHTELDKPVSECPKAKAEICMDCKGVVCVDVDEDRVVVGEKTGEVVLVYDNVRDCTMKTGEVDELKHKLLKDVIWDLTTPLKGMKKHMALIERVEGGERDG